MKMMKKPMAKKTAVKKTAVKKAQTGAKQKMTPMQELKKKYSTADTSAMGDLRFEDLGPMDRYNKMDQKRIMDIQSAYDKKYGKGKPAVKKNKNGGTLSPTKKSVGKTIGKLNKAMYGAKTSKKK
jgi:hypothetical protein